MNQDELRAAGVELLAQARVLRAAYPDPAALAAVAVPARLPDDRCGAADRPAGRVLRYLRDEMLLVQAGRAGTLTVLDDEMANVERLLTCP